MSWHKKKNGNRVTVVYEIIPNMKSLNRKFFLSSSRSLYFALTYSDLWWKYLNNILSNKEGYTNSVTPDLKMLGQRVRIKKLVERW